MRNATFIHTQYLNTNTFHGRTYLVAVAAQRTATELLLAVPETRQFGAAVHAEMLADCTRPHAHNQLVTHTLPNTGENKEKTITFGIVC